MLQGQLEGGRSGTLGCAGSGIRPASRETCSSMVRILYPRAIAVNGSNCLIKNPLEMGIVASHKNPLQIERSYLHVSRTLEVEMRLKMKARQEVTAVTAGQYRGASKKGKGVILEQFMSTTGYSRWYARFVLRHQGRRVQADKHRTLLAVSSSRRARKRRRIYDEKVVAALLKLWRLMDYICGKRLQPVLTELV